MQRDLVVCGPTTGVSGPLSKWESAAVVDHLTASRRWLLPMNTRP
jgi:hypothetical protein